MKGTAIPILLVAGMTLLLPVSGSADVPAPPANQSIGMFDSSFNALTEADCRVCHDSGVPDRHHGLYKSVIPSLSVVPYPQFNIPGPVPPQERYSCMSCHSDTFILEQDCTVCHNTASPHHQTALADAGDCKACHGDLVDNRGDGHYIPTYSPSLVTPTPSQGDADQLNDYGNGAGACNYCHDQDVMLPGTPVLILDNHDLHHGINLEDFGNRCNWCHDVGLPFDDVEQIRVCEGCHGPDSLHNIQTDSNGDGLLVVGGEDAGYGHVGRDAGPDDSDCWGCHGFGIATAPRSGPVVPSIDGLSVTVMKAGADTNVVVSGSGFTNTVGELLFESAIKLTAADGSSLTLTPDLLLQGIMAVTIPGSLAPGNYDLQAVKAPFSSNPAVISVTPKVVITDATADGATVTINGSGFGGYAAGSGTSVTTSDTTVEATIVSWNDTTIVAAFDSAPNQVTVNSLFGTETSEVGGGVDTWKLRIPLADTADIQVTFLPYNGFLLVEQQINGQRTYGFGMEQDGMIFWFDSVGTVFYGVVDHNAATMWGMVINFQGVTSFWYAEQ